MSDVFPTLFFFHFFPIASRTRRFMMAPVLFGKSHRHKLGCAWHEGLDDWIIYDRYWHLPLKLRAQGIAPCHTRLWHANLPDKMVLGKTGFVILPTNQEHQYYFRGRWLVQVLTLKSQLMRTMLCLVARLREAEWDKSQSICLKKTQVSVWNTSISSVEVRKVLGGATKCPL